MFKLSYPILSHPKLLEIPNPTIRMPYAAYLINFSSCLRVNHRHHHHQNSSSESVVQSERQRRRGRTREWWDVDEEAARWDVSEVDVAKVVPRVVSHRVRVRSGPEHEVLSSVVFMAVPPASEGGEKKGTWKRRTVKDIIVKLLGEV